MSVRKVSVQDAKQIMEIGRIRNDQTPGFKQGASVKQQEIGRVNNEQAPHLQREFLPEEREIGVINNEKRD